MLAVACIAGCLQLQRLTGIGIHGYRMPVMCVFVAVRARCSLKNRTGTAFQPMAGGNGTGTAGVLNVSHKFSKIFKTFYYPLTHPITTIKETTS